MCRKAKILLGREGQADSKCIGHVIESHGDEELRGAKTVVGGEEVVKGGAASSRTVRCIGAQNHDVRVQGGAKRFGICRLAVLIGCSQPSPKVTVLGNPVDRIDVHLAGLDAHARASCVGVTMKLVEE